MYWIIPDFVEARRYLPLDDGAPAVEWFFVTRFVAASPARRGLALLMATAGRLRGKVAARLAPCCAVIATREGRSPGSPSVLTDAALDVSLRGPAVQTVLFTSGQDDGSRVVVLPFVAGSKTPAVVIKIARRSDFTEHTAKEQATLIQLRTRLGPELGQTLPRPLGVAGDPGRRAFVEAAVPGRMLAASVGGWRTPVARQLEDLRVAADWLSRFHLATVERRVQWGAAETQQWIEPRLSEYERAFGLEDAEVGLVAMLRERSNALAGEELPIVWAHNDFNPWHIYRDGSRVSVIDWEFGGERLEDREGLPACDLVYFLTHWMQLARCSRGESADVQVFMNLWVRRASGDVRARAAHRALTEYLSRMGVSEAFLPLLVVYTWLERAVDRHRRERTLGAPTDSPRRNNRFVQYVEVLARSRDELLSVAPNASCRADLPGS
jgi:hypothetical protein